jgi:TAG lipase/steryl ester hydrolase/phospholipase A2/LPA acyltransferase
VMPGLGRENNLRPGIRKIMTDASVATVKQVLRGYLDWLQGNSGVGPRAGMVMNAVNSLMDQRFIGDINIIPDKAQNSLSRLLKMLTEEEMIDLIKAGERTTWPKVPVITTTTRIGRTLDNILHAFEIDEAHWLNTAPQTDAALVSDKESNPRRRKPAAKKRSKRTQQIIAEKAQTKPRIAAS